MNRSWYGRSALMLETICRVKANGDQLNKTGKEKGAFSALYITKQSWSDIWARNLTLQTSHGWQNVDGQEELQMIISNMTQVEWLKKMAHSSFFFLRSLNCQHGQRAWLWGTHHKEFKGQHAKPTSTLYHNTDLEGPSLQVSVPTTFYFQVCSVIVARSILAPSVKVIHDKNHLMSVCGGNFCDVGISSAKRYWRYHILLIKIVQPKARQELPCVLCLGCGILAFEILQCRANKPAWWCGVKGQWCKDHFKHLLCFIAVKTFPSPKFKI